MNVTSPRPDKNAAAAAAVSTPIIEVDGIHKTYGSRVIALENVHLDFNSGELTSLLGPSGCGKTTLLKILAGFDTGARYECLELRGAPITGGSEQIGVIFQEGSLFPWLTLKQNILFGSRLRAMAPEHRQATLGRYLERFGLSGLERKYPDQLSGGQQQRAAVARALANHPLLLLADEPFRALDSKTRLASQIFLWNEIKAREQTLCLITHDIDEALLLGDRLLILGDRPTRVEGRFEVRLPGSRETTTVLSTEFHDEKQRFVDYCRSQDLPLFPGSEPGSEGSGDPGRPRRKRAQ